jgi:hypothetical protein
MPKYFFNAYNGRTLIDREGEEFPDKPSAWREATVTTGRMIANLIASPHWGEVSRILAKF